MADLTAGLRDLGLPAEARVDGCRVELRVDLEALHGHLDRLRGPVQELREALEVMPPGLRALAIGRLVAHLEAMRDAGGRL